MESSALYLHSIGYAHPKTEVSNDFIIGLGADTNEQWIQEKLGICCRRSVLSLEYIKNTKNQKPTKAIEFSQSSPTELAIDAAKMACQRAGIELNQIGLIICDCCFPNQVAPVESQRIARGLGLKCQAYDVLTACPAFALHVDYLASFRPEELPEYVLAITTAALTQTVDYTDRTDPIIWGDGAAAAVFSTKHSGKLKVIHSFFDADPTRSQAVVVNRYKYFKQDGRAVRDFSVRQTVRMLKELETKFALNWEKDVFIGHQANATMLRQITANRNIPDSNHWHNAEEFGNQASAGAPIVLAMNWDKLQVGNRVVTAVLGAGLSWGCCIFEVQ